MFPEGSRVIPNPNGTAPGIDLEVLRGGTPPSPRIFCLPGVPAEMREMWHKRSGALRAWGPAGGTIRHRRIKCFGAGESHIEANCRTSSAAADAARGH